MDRNITLRRTAQQLVKEAQIDKAVEAYEEVVSSGDADPYDFVYAGDLYVKLELLDDAISHFDRGVAAYSRLGFNRNAIALCRRILRLDGGRRTVYRELGDLYSSEELLDDALESYLAFLERVPPEEREEQPFREALTRAEQLAPRRAPYVHRLSEFLQTIGRADDAADLVARCTEAARSVDAGEEAPDLLAQAAALNPFLAQSTGLRAPERFVREETAPARSRAPRGEDAIAPAQDFHCGGFQEVDLETAESGWRGDRRAGASRAAAVAETAAADPLPAAVDLAAAPPSAGSEEPYGLEDDPAAATRGAIAERDWKLARRWVDAWLLRDPTSLDAADAFLAVAEALEDRDGLVEALTLKGDLLIQRQDLAASVPLFWRVLELDAENRTARRRMTRFQELGLVAADALERAAQATDAQATDTQGADAQPADAPGGACAADAGESSPGNRRTGEEDAPSDGAAGQAQVEPVIGFAEALAILAELRGDAKVTVEPGATTTHYERGVMHMEMGRLEEALSAFETALKQPVSDEAQTARLWELRGKCLSALGRHREAISELEPVLAKLGAGGHDTAALHYFLALEHETLGEWDAARQRLKEVLETQPGFAPAIRRLSQLEERAA